MYDISLYGHLTRDYLITSKACNNTLGGLANVWEALLILDKSIKINVQPIYIGEALIYANLETSERFSKSILNLIKCNFSIKKSSVSHFLYINELDLTEVLLEIEGIVTADVCVGKDLDYSLLKYVDYLFASDEENIDLELAVKNIKGCVVLHKSDGAKVINKTINHEFKLSDSEIFDNINVLGAGDIFAACFLYKLLSGEKNNFSLIEHACKEATKILKFKNEKI